MVKRFFNTGAEMVASGQWAKVGRKHYRHVSGAEIKYDCNRWGWEFGGRLYQTLAVAKYVAEQSR